MRASSSNVCSGFGAVAVNIAITRPLPALRVVLRVVLVRAAVTVRAV